MFNFFRKLLPFFTYHNVVFGRKRFEIELKIIIVYACFDLTLESSVSLKIIEEQNDKVKCSLHVSIWNSTFESRECYSQYQQNEFFCVLKLSKILIHNLWMKFLNLNKLKGWSEKNISWISKIPSVCTFFWIEQILWLTKS